MKLNINGFFLLSTEEFTAHGADVKCVGLGHKSGRVMVTGGDDRKVNLWSVGKPHCIMVSIAADHPHLHCDYDF